MHTKTQDANHLPEKAHTRRYQKTEEKLLNTAYNISTSDNKQPFTVHNLAYQARISTSTFYRHFRSLLDFSRRHEKKLKKAAELLYDELSQKDLPPEALFLRIVLLIYKGRSSVRLLLSKNDDRAIRAIFWVFRPLITKQWPSYGAASDRLIYSYFVAEATEAIRLWVIDQNFRQKHIETIANQVFFISKIIAPALAPIIKV